MNIRKIVVGFINTNCYLVHDGKVAVVIDPGANADRIIEAAEAENVEIKYIFLTHAHFDHVLAVKEIMEICGAKLVASEGERERLCSAELSGQTMLRRREFIPLKADVEVSDGDVIAVGDMKFEFILTPGHTEGSVCIICEDVLFSGDTLFCGTCGRCDLAGGDYEKILHSLKRLHELSGDYKVMPGHEQETTLSHERVYNPYMAEAMRL